VLWALAVDVQIRREIFGEKASSQYTQLEISAFNKRRKELADTKMMQQYLEEHYGETFNILKDQCGGVEFPLGMQKSKILALKKKLNICVRIEVLV